MRKALEAPISAIASNSGETPGKILQDLRKQKASLKGAEKTWLGFNADANKVGDLKQAGIVDPLKVTKTAFVNALSVASNYLIIGAAVTDIPEKKEKPAGAGGHMPEMY